MQIEISIDAKYKTPKLIIKTESVTDKVNEIIKKLSENPPNEITGFKEDLAEIIKTERIYRFYSSQGKVFAVTDNGEYIVRRRLYEIEEMSFPKFVRISYSEIINLKKVRNFDLSLTGTIRVKFIDGSYTYVSRRYVSKIKNLLNI